MRIAIDTREISFGIRQKVREVKKCASNAGKRVLNSQTLENIRLYGLNLGRGHRDDGRVKCPNCGHRM